MPVLGKIDSATFANNVGVTQNSKVVTKNAADKVDAGDILLLNGVQYLVAGITSSTSILLSANYVAATNATLGGTVRRTAPKELTQFIHNGGDSVSSSTEIVGVSQAEAQLAQNKNRGLNSPGWWTYRTYVDAAGNNRHKSECIAFLNDLTGDASDDTLAGDFISTVTTTNPANASVAATNTQAFSVTATVTAAAAAIDGAANAGNTAGRTAGTYVITGTGGTGSGLKVSLVVDNNGAATPTLTAGGGGYTDNDTVTLSRTGAYGGASDVTVNVNGVSATANYQWQVSEDGGVTWANTSTGSNSTTATYTTAATAAGDNGNKYRCVVGTSQGATKVTSNAATLTVT